MIALRRGREADAASAGAICYRAFKDIAEAHNFVPDFPSPEAAAGLLGNMIRHEGFYDIVAEIEGRIVGTNFLDERNSIAGLGPITVEPGDQNGQVGRLLMQAAMDQIGRASCRERG